MKIERVDTQPECPTSKDQVAWPNVSPMKKVFIHRRQTVMRQTVHSEMTGNAFF